MTLIDHLDELRRRIAISLVALAMGAAISFWKVKMIVRYLLIPPVDKLVFFSPAEAFITYCKVAVFAGLILASPVIIFQCWRFISAGLADQEQKTILLFFPFSTLLFIAGAAFAFYAVIPWALRFLINFAAPDVIPILSISKYISFVIMLVLLFGAVFELPVAVVLLAKLGMVTPEFLARNRKYAIIVIFIAAAVLTPTPDAFTQVLMAVPLVVLYEISILLSRIVKPKCACSSAG